MKMTPSELGSLLIAASSSAKHDAKEIAELRERVLRLEHKINELFDTLSDFRVNQIMNAQDQSTFIHRYVDGKDE